MIQRDCPVCGSTFTTTKNPKYSKTTCSQVCSNKFFIRRERKTPKTFTCINCSKETNYIYSSHNKFCSLKCKTDYNHNTIVLPLFEEGKIKSRPALKKLLTKKHGYKCVKCEISTWLEKRLSLEVDHIDGNCTNNLPSNLRLLCPNCHSQTSTWKSRNKGSGRGSRNQPLY